MKPLVCTLAGVAVALALTAGPAAAQRQQGGGASAGASAGARTSGGGDGGSSRAGSVASSPSGGSVSGPSGSSGGGSYSGPPAGFSGPRSSGSSAGSGSYGSPYGAGGRVNPANGNSGYVREMYGTPGDRAVPRGARPNPGAPTVGQAVLRPNAPGHHPPGWGDGSGGWYPYYPYYGWGLGLGYYSFYDPYWWWGAPYLYDYGPYGYYASEQAGRGGLKLKVEPTNAEVYVDGYYMGTVDDFDGTFQKLELETGAHHVEIRAAGYQTIAFDVRIEFNETVTYRGALQLLSKR